MMNGLEMTPREFWSRKYGRPISDDEAKEIRQNLLGFFGVLGKWHQEQNAVIPGCLNRESSHPPIDKKSLLPGSPLSRGRRERINLSRIGRMR